MVLGCYVPAAASSAAEARYARLHGQISRYLAARLAAAPSGNLPSYGDTLRDTLWVADNAVTIHSLWLYDQTQRRALSAAAKRRWLQLMLISDSAGLGLPYSELTARRPPRGCAMSWLAKYMAGFADDRGATWWAGYKRAYKYNLGVACLFREYPPGINLPGDYDSSTILLGAGAAATGLALSGAKYQRDYYTYYQLLTAVAAGNFIAETAALWGNDSWGGVTDSSLARAIRFNAAARR